MKTRMHRFWLSITLAAGSLASPLNAKAWSHDLPTRWSPGVSSSSHSDAEWNYLLDDCLDRRESIGASALVASTSGDFPMADITAPTNVDFDAALSRNSLARFTSEMACWVNQWERLQANAGQAALADLAVHSRARTSLIAARPDRGHPPAPAIAPADTCGYEAEYQAMQAAAELLEQEMACGVKPSVENQTAVDGQLERSLAAAAEIEAAAIDSMPAAPAPQALCGGEPNEIVSVNPQPNQSALADADEYVSYDVDPRDIHWMGGLGKSWKLNLALEAALAAAEREELAADSDEEFAEAEVDTAEAVASGSNNPEQLNDQLPALQALVADAIDWLDNASCIIAAEMCGMDHVTQFGERWGQATLAVAERSMTSYVEMGYYLELPPAVANPSLDVVVVYADTDGMEIAVPSSLARAWNRPEIDETLAGDTAAVVDPYDTAVSELSGNGIASNEVVTGGGTDASSASGDDAVQAGSSAIELPAVDFSQLRREILKLIAAKLDSLGLTCLETADRLSNWANPQLASRGENDIR